MKAAEPTESSNKEKKGTVGFHVKDSSEWGWRKERVGEIQKRRRG